MGFVIVSQRGAHSSLYLFSRQRAFPRSLALHRYLRTGTHSSFRRSPSFSSPTSNIFRFMAADNGRSTISHENSPNAGPSYSAQEDNVDTRPVTAAAAVQCLCTIDRRRAGEIDTADATIQFHRILPDDERGNAALRRYIEMCTELDVERATAAVRGGAPISGEPTSSVQPSANHRTQLTGVERATATVPDRAPLSGEPTSSDRPSVNRRA
ncbi:hypothetical protein JB92DRAFT_2213712 [Gautieria morchelliformis]|nr:hypothetical protein JB92DRAFT_2213712 [Gautieria morchelliformis]